MESMFTKHAGKLSYKCKQVVDCGLSLRDLRGDVPMLSLLSGRETPRWPVAAARGIAL